MIFYLDTSSSFLYAGLFDTSNNNLVDKISMDLGRELSSKTLSLINEMFRKHNLLFSDLKKVIVVNGPGSFTGIRVGVTIAKTIAWSVGIPIIPISSLTAMALSYFDKEEFIAPMIDARRGYCYGSIYDPVNQSFIMNEGYYKISSLIASLESLPADFSIMSNDDIKCDYSLIKYQPDFINIIEKTKDNAPVDVHLVDANYLKMTEAEEKYNDC